MSNYPFFVTFHIIFAGMWLVTLIFDYKNRSGILSQQDPRAKEALIYNYLSTINTVSIIASLGVLVTGILMIIFNPGYDFFDFSANHWLVSKQFVFIVIYIITFAKLIPATKRVKRFYSENKPDSDINKAIKRVWFQLNIINILIVVNLLFALSRRLM